MNVLQPLGQSPAHHCEGIRLDLIPEVCMLLFAIHSIFQAFSPESGRPIRCSLCIVGRFELYIFLPRQKIQELTKLIKVKCRWFLQLRISFLQKLLSRCLRLCGGKASPSYFVHMAYVLSSSSVQIQCPS